MVSKTSTQSLAALSYEKQLGLRLTRAIIHRHNETDGDRHASVWGLDDIPHENSTPDYSAALDLSGLPLPKAVGISEEAIDFARMQDVDLWATGTNGDITTLPKHKPIIELLTAVTIAGHFPDKASIKNFLCSDVSLLRIPKLADRRRVFTALPIILEILGVISGHVSDEENDIELVYFDETSMKSSASALSVFRTKCDTDIALGKTVIALAGDEKDLSPSGRALLKTDWLWPSVNQSALIEVLRATHSVTGQLSETALRSALPSDKALSQMPWSLISNALHQNTTIKVASRLSNMTCDIRTSPRLTLNDTMVAAHIRSTLDRLVSDVRNWEAGTLNWSDVSSSILLSGPPGTGKTMLAEALAGSTNARFISTSYADAQKAGHLGDYLHEMSEHVETAISSAPSVFFLDEIDSYRRRGGNGSKNDKYMSSVVNGLLEQLTRLNNAEGVMTLGATNYPDVIDPALIRSGRFDVKLFVGFPDRTNCEKILQANLGAPHLELGLLPNRLVGLTGADIAALARDAKGRARHDRTKLTPDHVAQALQHITDDPDDSILKRVAYHEAGHAIVGHVLGMPPARRIFVSLQGGGVEMPRRRVQTLQTAKDEIATLLAGRAAEELIYGYPSSGAGGSDTSDLALATEIALNITTKWGLGNGSPLYRPMEQEEWHRMPACLRKNAEQHLEDGSTKASEILADYVDALERVANALFKQREIDGSRLQDLIGFDGGVPT